MMEATEQAVRREIIASFDALQTARRQIVSLDQQVEAARAALDGTREEAIVDDLAALVEEKLQRAAELAETKPLAARGMLESIVALYDGNQELAPLVQQARDRIRELRARPGGSAGPDRAE